MPQDAGPIQRLVVLDDPSQAIVCNYAWGGQASAPDALSIIKIGRALAQFAGSFDGQEILYAHFDAGDAGGLPARPPSALVCEFRGGMSAFVLYSSEEPVSEGIAREFAAAVLRDVQTQHGDVIDELRGGPAAPAGGLGKPGQGGAGSPGGSKPPLYQVSRLQACYKEVVDGLLEQSLSVLANVPAYIDTL